MARKKKVEPVTFRIYPDGKWFYAVVNIWPTKKAMQDYKQCGRGYTAICTGMEGIRNGRKTGQFCEINFHRGGIAIGVVSHEMGHAAFNWAGRRRISMSQVMDANVHAFQQIWQNPNEGKHKVQPNHNSEERVVWVLGEMVRRFCNKAYDLGLYK
jgi:hypothetical protein